MDGIFLLNAKYSKAIVIILFLVFVSCIVAVYIPAKRIHNMAITDTINDLR